MRSELMCEIDFGVYAQEETMRNFGDKGKNEHRTQQKIRGSQHIRRKEKENYRPKPPRPGGKQRIK